MGVTSTGEPEYPTSAVGSGTSGYKRLDTGQPNSSTTTPKHKERDQVQQLILEKKKNKTIFIFVFIPISSANGLKYWRKEALLHVFMYFKYINLPLELKDLLTEMLSE